MLHFADIMPPDGRADDRLGRLRSLRPDPSPRGDRQADRRARDDPRLRDRALQPAAAPEALRSHFFQLVYTLRALGLTAVILAEAPGDYGQLTTLGVEDYVCDLTVILRNIVDGGRRRRSIEVEQVPPQRALQGRVPLHRSRRAASRSSRSTPRNRRDTEQGRALLERRRRARRDDARRLAAQLDHHRARPDRQRQDDARRAVRARRRAARRARRLLRLRGDAADPAAQLREIGMPMDAVLESGAPEGPSAAIPKPPASKICSSTFASASRSSSRRSSSRQHLVDRARLVRERLPAVHDRRRLDPARARPQRADHADRHRAMATEHTAPYLSTIADAILTLDYCLDSYELDGRCG